MIPLVFIMIQFFGPILDHFCPSFMQIAQMGLILPKWGLILPKKPPPTPVLYSAVTNMYEHETPPAPPPKIPLSGPILKVGKMNYCLGKIDPIWTKCLKMGKTFLEVGKKIYSCFHLSFSRVPASHRACQKL